MSAEITPEMYAALRGRLVESPARRKEKTWRAATATHRAQGALAKLHLDEYQALYAFALAEVYAERGPLPGDEHANGTS